MQVCLLSPTCLIPTEEVDPVRVAELQAQILRAGCWEVPITVERDALCVMDGHHRLAVAEALQLPLVPVLLLDYSAVRVESWRPGETITPARILEMARSGRKFPCKTTRHIFDQGLPNCNLPLESLRCLAPAKRSLANVHCHKPGAGLPPILRPATSELLIGNGALLLNWIGRHGSPVNLVWPGELEGNVAALSGVLQESRVAHALYYGAKVNKSPGLVAAALRAKAGVDVSSVFELRDARRLGADGTQLVATGPAKTPAFHKELIDCNALISVDSPEELEDLIRELPASGSAQPVLLRLRPASQARSRFGMPPPAVRHCLSRIAGDSRLRFDGLHFHLSGYDWAPRAQAIDEASGLIAESRARGFTPRMIDIGGGLPIQYVDQLAYRAHLDAQKPGDYRTGKIPSSFYPYGGELSAAEWLRCLLQARMADGRTVATYFVQEGLVLAMEPGRALADQSAISVFRVSRVKAVGPDAHVVFVEGSSFSAGETWFSSEFLVDPILVPAMSSQTAARPIRAYLAGHSCLDDDVLSNRWLTFPVAPRAGDLLVYANTAGYQMDLLENEFHRHPMPSRLCVVQDAEGQPTLVPDTIGEAQCAARPLAS
jgi:diaminopimelate decarboxylase